MTTDSRPAWEIPYEHATELVNHWWWRPGWSPGTHWYAWHFTLDWYPDLQDLAAAYAPALEPFVSLDIIPKQWLHITVQGVGNAGDIPHQELQLIRDAVDDRLSGMPAPTLTFHRPVLHREAIVIPPTDLQPLRAVRAAIRAGIADVWGAERVPETDAYKPHFSLAYVNRNEDAQSVLAALARVQPEPVTTTLHTVSLIDLNRDDGMYVWGAVHEVELAR